MLSSELFQMSSGSFVYFERPLPPSLPALWPSAVNFAFMLYFFILFLIELHLSGGKESRLSTFHIRKEKKKLLVLPSSNRIPNVAKLQFCPEKDRSPDDIGLFYCF
jgi:hypothetical protein